MVDREHTFGYGLDQQKLQLFRNTGYRESNETGEKCDSAYQSVGYDSGICLSNYRSTDGTFISRDKAGPEGIEETLRNLSLREQESRTAECQSSACLSLFKAEPITTVCDSSDGQSALCLEDQLFEQDEEGDTQLHLSIIRLDLSTTFRLIEMTRIPEYLNIQNKIYMHTALHLAVITSQPQVVRALVISGACLTMRDRHGNTALHLACKQGDLECVRQLTMPPNEEEKKYVWCISEMRSLPPGMIKPMQSHDICVMNYEGETSLHLALSSGAKTRNDIIRHLVDCCGANINVEDGKCGYTLLHQAVKSKDLEMIEFLLQYQHLAINQLCYSGNTPLDIAVSLSQPQVELILRMAGAICTESIDSSDDNQVDDFDDLMIGGLRLNM